MTLGTYGQAMIAEADKSLQLVNQYIITGCEESDIKNLLSNIASATELFLKRDVFPTENSRENFYSFIEELKAHSISQTNIDFIHNIRRAYNSAKHDPNSAISALQVKKLIENFKLAIDEILIAGIGRVNSSLRTATVRAFWVCAWDHFVQGETEVVIFLPKEYDGFLSGPAPALDRVSIHGTKWDDFQADLPNFGTIYPHESLIPKEQVKFWMAGGDCLPPFVFEGEYNSLIVCLSKFLIEVDLVPGLAREDSPLSLLQVAILAVSNTYANNPSAPKETQSANALILATNQYAVLQKFSGRLEYYINKVVETIDQVPQHLKSAVSGPIWITKEAYDASKSIYRDDCIGMLVDSKNRIALSLDLGA